MEKRPFNIMDVLTGFDPDSIKYFMDNAGPEASKVCAVLADTVEMSPGSQDDHLGTPLRIASGVLALDPKLVQTILGAVSSKK